MRVDVAGFAGGDRTSIDLPAPQQKVLEAVTGTGTPVILVLINGSALAVNWAEENVSAILEAWYPGGQGGDAVASVIAGDVNPAGRLPLTFYRNVEDLPPFRDYAMANRTYRYFRGEVLYPFGYGLSYTHFEYGEAGISRSSVEAGEDVELAVTVTNVGNRAGDEVVQLYLSYAGRERAPIRSLVGFRRITLAPGESRRLEFSLDSLSMSTVDENGVRSVRPGSANLWVGGGQPDQRPRLPSAAGVNIAFEITGAAALR